MPLTYDAKATPNPALPWCCRYRSASRLRATSDAANRCPSAGRLRQQTGEQVGFFHSIGRFFSRIFGGSKPAQMFATSSP